VSPDDSPSLRNNGGLRRRRLGAVGVTPFIPRMDSRDSDEQDKLVLLSL
jgi:hypothetical protein